VELSQLLCVDWLLAWNVVLSQAGLGPTKQTSWYVLGGGQMFKQTLAARPPSLPGDYLIYNDGLSPFSSV